MPLAAQGYRFSVEFDQAVELASQASVQISGVPVGHVVSVELDHKTGLSKAVIEINKQYAPRPADTRAILRSEDAAGGDLRRALAGQPGRPQAARRRQPAPGPGGPDRPARPDLLGV